MTPEQSLGFAAVLASIAYLIRAIPAVASTWTAAHAKQITSQSNAVDANVAQDTYILQSLASLQHVVAEMQAEAIKSAHREADYKLEIARLTWKLEQQEGESLTVLKRLEPKIDTTNRQAFLANKQLSDMRHENAVIANPDDTAKTDADHKLNQDADQQANQVAPVVNP